MYVRELFEQRSFGVESLKNEIIMKWGDTVIRLIQVMSLVAAL